MKNERDFIIAIKNCDTFKKFEKYQQAYRYGIEYLKQNPKILQSDVKLINDVLCN